ncbi:MAG: c-type cytochrome [Planctomycetaceae bacterium]
MLQLMRLGRHPQQEFLLKLLNQLAQTPATDPFLRHTIRIAVRNHLLVDAIATSRPTRDLLDWHAAEIADIAPGAPTEPAADLLLTTLQQGVKLPGRQADQIRQVARYASPQRLHTFVDQLAGSKSPAPEQLRELLAVAAGLEARNVAPAEYVGRWADSLGKQFLAEQRNEGIDWTVRAVPGRPLEPDAFATQPRDYAGGSAKALFHSSLPKGERKTGIIRSEPFRCPANLTFFLAGHDGVPDKPLQQKNLVRLTLAGSGEVIASAPPPRNDVAQKVAWNLARHQNQPVRLEIVDGDDGTGFAWLAAGNFSLPALNPAEFSARDAAADLITRLKLESFAPRLAAIVGDEHASLPARLRWSGVLLALHPDARLSTLLAAVSGEFVDAGLQSRILSVIVSRDDAEIEDCLKQTVRTATAPQQRQLAEQLSADRAGAEALLTLTAAGLSSPRLLTDPRIVERVHAADPDSGARIAKLVAGLPEPAAEIEKLLADRRRAFASAGTNSERGRTVYKQHCAACHQLGNEGKKVGPVLDGIGLRGPDRLFEDILDPSRNVDAAFRTTTILNKQGQVLSGLLMREEGATLILVDNKGMEFAVPKADVEEQSTSGLSLMPGNWGEVIPAADLNELVAELLRHSTKVNGQ